MIVRLLLAVLVGAALIGAAMPVITDAQHDVASTTAAREADRLAGAITQLHRSNDPVPLGVPGARTPVTVDLPTGDDEATVAIEEGIISYRAPPGTLGTERVGVDLRVLTDEGVTPADQSLVLRGTQTVVLRYVLVDGEPTVTVAVAS